MNNKAKFALEAIKLITKVNHIDTYVGDSHYTYLRVSGIEVSEDSVEFWGEDGCGGFLARNIDFVDITIGGSQITIRVLFKEGLLGGGETIISGQAA